MSIPSHTRKTFLWISLAGIVLTGCKDKRTIRAVVSGPQMRLGFVFGTQNGGDKIVPLEFLEVVTCVGDSTLGPSNNVVWRIESATKPNIVKTSQVVYGEVPEGARATVEAQPMVPGCYWVRDSQARYRFEKFSGGLSGSGDLLATDPVFKKK